MKLNLIIAFLLLHQVLFSQNLRPQREGFTLELAIDEETFYKDDIPKSPYFVKGTMLQIFPTELLNIEVEIKNDSIYSMKVVEKNLHPKKTITIDFKQNTKGKISEGMTLAVTNPFDKKLRYEASMYIYGNNNWIETSIIPIYPKIVGYEMWSDVILSLVLKNWKLE